MAEKACKGKLACSQKKREKKGKRALEIAGVFFLTFRSTVNGNVRVLGNVKIMFYEFLFCQFFQ